MKTQQIIFQHPHDETLPLELSFLAGKNTLILPSVLTKSGIETIFNAYREMGLTNWKHFYNKIENYKFEQLIEEIPEPDEAEGMMIDVSLKSGGQVKFLARFVGTTAEVVQ